MTPLPYTTREELAALLTEHCGNVAAAAASIGVNTPALYMRLSRVGLSTVVKRFDGETQRPPEPMPPNAFALAAFELAVENQGLTSALVGAERVIDYLAAKVAAQAQELGARDDSRTTGQYRGRRQFERARARLRATAGPEPA